MTRDITTKTKLGTDTERCYKERKKIIKNFKAEEFRSPGSEGWGKHDWTGACKTIEEEVDPWAPQGR